MANTTGRKFGGRKAGTPNRTTNTELKQAIEDVSYKAIESILNDFDTLTTNERLKLLQTCLRYVMPQLKATELQLDTNDNVPKWVSQILNDEYKEQ